jgi:acyl carrier protein
MNRNDVTSAVLAFFDSKGGLPGENIEQKLNCLYLDQKIIDSMGIIEMVTTFEEDFDIQFDADLMQSPEFQTVGGIIGIIQNLYKEKS